MSVPVLLCGMLAAFPADASEQMRPANVIESGRWAAAFYGVRSEQKDLEFRVRGADLIQVPLKSGGTAQFFANADTDLAFDGEGTSAVLKLTWRPASGLQYTFKAGTGDYEIRVPSGSVVNVLENGPAGLLWGAEVGWTMISDTPVTPAVALLLGYSRSDYRMERLRSGGAPVAVSQRFSLEEVQGSVAASKRWKRFEPYGGLRFFRQSVVLYDSALAERVRGGREGWSPYAGLRWEFLPRESLVLEVAGADETLFAAGLSIGF
jgi:hypothetical protein